MNYVGRTVRALRQRDIEAARCDAGGHKTGGYAWVKEGTRGTVIAQSESNKSITVVYTQPDGSFARFNHSLSYEGKNWEFMDDNAQQYHDMIIQSERSYALYRAQSTEVIDGYVPQVVYAEEIVWQGDPVAKTDESGEDIPKGDQSTAALKAAEAKIKEVVKKQFA